MAVAIFLGICLKAIELLSLYDNYTKFEIDYHFVWSITVSKGFIIIDLIFLDYCNNSYFVWGNEKIIFAIVAEKMIPYQDTMIL